MSVLVYIRAGFEIRVTCGKGQCGIMHIHMEIEMKREVSLDFDSASAPDSVTFLLWVPAFKDMLQYFMMCHNNLR